MRRGKRAALLTIVTVAFASGTANAQTNERVFESLEFRAVTPGARAQAMGKTFVGLADDATAAASNPAGLSNLLVPEVSVEVSGAELQHDRFVLLSPFTTLPFHQRVGFLSFASFVSPLSSTARGLRNVTVAAFYSALQHDRENFSIPNRLPDGQPVPQGGYFGNIDIRARAAGISGAVLLSKKISLGGSLAIRHLSLDVRSNTSASGDETEFRSGTITTGSQHRMGWQAGALVKPKHWLTIGAAYNAGTTFQTTTTIRGKFTLDADPEHPNGGPTLPIEQIPFVTPVHATDYRIPDRATVGLGIRPISSVVVLTDIASVRYSQRINKDRFVIVDFLAQPSAGLKPALYSIPDVVELHTGGEWRFVRRGRVFAIRAGVFSDPDHQMRFDFDKSNHSTQAHTQFVQFDSYFPGTIWGRTVGGGIVLRNRYQIDAAYTRSANAREVVVSSVIRFPG